MSSPDDPTSTPSRRTAVLAAVGLAVGLLGGSLLGILWPDRAPAGVPDPAVDAAAADALVAAAERSAGATFTAEGRYERTVDGEVVDHDVVVVVQRPPDRLVLGYGSWDGVVDGDGVACRREGLRGAWRSCQRLGGSSLAELDDDRLGVLRGAVAGADPSYRVVDLGEGCFDIVIRGGQRFEPGLGGRATLCFDPVTGAEVRRVVHHAEARDETVMDRVTAEVDPTDLDIPAEDSG